MNKFKVGDKVKLIKANEKYKHELDFVGKEGIVRRVDEGSRLPIEVKFSSYYLSFYEYQLRLVEDVELDEEDKEVLTLVNLIDALETISENVPLSSKVTINESSQLEIESGKITYILKW